MEVKITKNYELSLTEEEVNLINNVLGRTNQEYFLSVGLSEEDYKLSDELYLVLNSWL